MGIEDIIVHIYPFLHYFAEMGIRERQIVTSQWMRKREREIRGQDKTDAVESCFLQVQKFITMVTFAPPTPWVKWAVQEPTVSEQ